uniref:Mitotic spindle assembly checkpoint protein MAD2B n=1 Tax=Suricata suricatta TaxID=37032 RepID=A0A673TXJ5_SURSU
MTTLTRQDLNFGQVVADVLCEFLEVAVHLILYVREVYPVGIFQKRKKYNVPVQMSCHPELNQYIQDTLHCVKPLLEKNDVEKVVVVILDKEHRPVEKFVFEITQPPLLSISSDSLLSHVEQLLRAFILKISVCDAVLDHNPPGVLTPTLFLGVSVATLAWSAVSGPYCVVSSHPSSFLCFRNSLKARLLQEVTLIDSTGVQSRYGLCLVLALGLYFSPPVGVGG